MRTSHRILRFRIQWNANVSRAVRKLTIQLNIPARQPDHSKTIEGVLFQALVRAGAVSQDNADNPVKVSRIRPRANAVTECHILQIGLARAARTDAGVHAAGNLVSLKMITTVPDVPDLVARVNDELPPEIRLWGYVRQLLLAFRPSFDRMQVRVQNSFNARVSVVLAEFRLTLVI